MAESDKWRKIEEIARRDHKTNDKDFNKGRNDILTGNRTSKEAKYYLQCSGLD